MAIPLGLDDAGRWREGRRYHYLDAAYAEAVREAGGLPVHVSLDAEPEAIAARVDGLLLPGGDDFEPETPYPDDVRFAPVPAPQLAFDAALLAACLERGLPVLGVCYGMQLLARHHGGRLLYHLPLDLPGAREHRLPAAARHPVAVEAGSRLARVLGAGPLAVNSRHHQGVAEPGAGLRACARSEDGLIEALEAPGPGFALGVQWHPESLEAAHRRPLFGAFVAACGSGAG